ncbi:MAG: hypothetical protein AAF960_22545 [Bacteroidota bacterium]
MWTNYNKLREVFRFARIRELSKARQTPLLIGFGGFIIIMLFILPKTKRVNTTLYPTTEVNDVHTEGGIDALRANLEKLQKEASFNSYESSYQEMETAKAELTKTEEEIRQELLGAVNPNDQLDFEKELETVFDVGEHKAFFVRQIENCRIKMDLAVVGIGIIRVHQVLRGENPSVLEKDQEEFIRYIKEQVQYALAAEDRNYKAIVFKGLESSAG